MKNATFQLTISTHQVDEISNNDENICNILIVVMRQKKEDSLNEVSFCWNVLFGWNEWTDKKLGIKVQFFFVFKSTISGHWNLSADEG